MELCSEGERTVMAMLLLLCGTVTVLSTHYIYTVKEKGVHSCWLCFHLAILNLFSVIIKESSQFQSTHTRLVRRWAGAQVVMVRWGANQDRTLPHSHRDQAQCKCT